ncbi:MAG: hypothetical protein OJF59_000230 [Cytophagales bacterium]|jgi:hypothetical protein|nr:hypothetical protein [Bacteroidota bacterium]MBS1982052.1 hypothetical protein [Bacteroidota bacterium]WHZ06477.1 MAG: hypothetical protein OJF59_000230 [Cytophagales bacterium]
MKKIYLVFCAFSISVLFNACSSGKAALKKGDYYDATMEAIQRLRENPNRKKAIEVLTQAYPLTVDYIDNTIQNGIKADDPKKWRTAVAGYQRINFLSDQINTSPGALKVIPHPQTRYKELADAKTNAADEAYNEGINEMMKNTRNDYKQAYYDFKDANSFQQGYKESIEMQNQAEFKATLRVAFEEINNSRFNYGTFQPVINSLQRLFLSFKPVAQKDTVPPQQYLRIIFNGYQQNRPYISTRTETQTRQVVVGQVKGSDGKMVDQLQSVSANITYFHKTISGNSQANVTISDPSNNPLQNFSVNGAYSWVYDWATFSGDSRALSGNAASWVQRREVFPNDQEIYNQTIRDLQNSLAYQLKSFYSQY